jgi:hypothetical protein
MRELTRAYLALMDEKTARSGGYPKRVVPTITFEENRRSFSYGRREEPDFGGLAAFTLLDFVKLPSNIALIESALSRPEVKRYLTQLGVALVPMSFAYNILQPFGTRILIRQHGTTLDEGVFDNCFLELEAHISSDVDGYRHVAPLLGFAMTMEETRVGPFTIRKMNDAEYILFNEIPTDPRAFPAGLLRDRVEYLAELSVEAKRGEAALGSLDQDRFWWLVAILKVAGEGSFLYHNIWTFPSGWTGTVTSVGNVVRPRPHPSRRYTLNESDLPTVSVLWARAARYVGAPQPFWFLALKRFSEGVNRAGDDEALLDYWIACESLFGDDEQRGEMSYRLSLRLAYFVGRDPSERAEIRTLAKKAYGTRSAIVHGAKKVETKRVAGHAKSMENLTRRALAKCIESNYRSRNEMNGLLEQLIVGASPSG